jgi:hypothetical protein
MKSGAELRTSLFERGAGLSDRVHYRLMETPEERDAIYLMRYRAYLHGGLISPSESQRIIDCYDDALNAWIFGVYIDGELCSALRVQVLTSEWRTSYSTELFGDVLHDRLDRGEVFIDPARLCADPDKGQRFPELPYLTLRLGYLACDHFKAGTGLAMVRTDHQGFYRRVFLSDTIAGPRSFPGWNSMKVVLTACDFRNARETIMSRFPIMRSSASERRMLFDRGSERDSLPGAVITPFERTSIVPLS